MAIPTSDKIRSGASPSEEGRFSRGVVLTALAVCYALNFVDRQLLGVLAGPIKAEMALTDSELGAMGGLAFALLYSTCAIPLAWLADRWSRTNVISISLCVWSAFTAMCGMAQTNTQLFLARMGVGVGEAGGLAPSYSLVFDLYPAHQRARALAAFNFAIPFGTAIGVMIGAFVAHRIGWRAAFITAGAIGLIFAPIFRFIVRDPKVRPDNTVKHVPFARKAAVIQALKKSSFWYASMGAVCSSIVVNGVIFWLPSFLERSFNLNLLERSLAFTILMLVGGVAGLWFGGSLVDRLGQKKKSMYATVPGVIALAVIPFYILGLNAPSIWIAVPALLIPVAMGFAFSGPIATIIQHLAPQGARATVSAIFLFFNASISIGLSIFLFGVLSDVLAPRFGDESLKYSIMCFLAFYLLSGPLFILAGRNLARDWVE